MTWFKPDPRNLPLAKMDAGWVKRLLETASTMNVKRTRLLALKPFTKWAVACELIETDPCEGIKVKVKDSDGHPTWTDEQIAQFRNYYPLGTKARFALELLLGVTLRRGDGISLGRQHVKDGWLVYTQEKNRKRKPVKVETPLPTDIVAAIEACPSPPDSLVFLTNDQGHPFSKRTFNRWFRVQIAAAGLPDTCVPHGLRKGGGCIMAESECTPHEIMSVMGHSSLKEAERYTKAFDRKRAAARAQKKIAEAKVKAVAESNVVPMPVAKR